MPNVPGSHLPLLSDGKTISLATVGSDGRPQVTAAWFVLEDDGVVGISLNKTRQKTKNLQADPKATLFVIDPANQFHTLEIRADAEIIDDPDYAYAEKVKAKYGTDVREMDGPGESRVWVRFHPVKINTFG